jgi:Spx/MgsR family transcriptional regulator
VANEVEFYFYASCTSCRKADAFLRSEGIPAIRRDIFKQRLNAKEIRALFERAGITVSEALSTRSRPYQDLDLADKNLSDDQIIELMADHPALLRRPILVSKAGVLIGFNQGAYEALPAALSSTGEDR